MIVANKYWNNQSISQSIKIIQSSGGKYQAANACLQYFAPRIFMKQNVNFFNCHLSYQMIQRIPFHTSVYPSFDFISAKNTTENCLLKCLTCPTVGAELSNMKWAQVYIYPTDINKTTEKQNREKAMHRKATESHYSRHIHFLSHTENVMLLNMHYNSISKKIIIKKQPEMCSSMGLFTSVPLTELLRCAVSLPYPFVHQNGSFYYFIFIIVEPHNTGGIELSSMKARHEILRNLILASAHAVTCIMNVQHCNKQGTLLVQIYYC